MSIDYVLMKTGTIKVTCLGRGAYTLKLRRRPEEAGHRVSHMPGGLVSRNAVPMLLIGLFDETGAFKASPNGRQKIFRERKSTWEDLQRFLYADSKLNHAFGIRSSLVVWDSFDEP